MKVATCGYHSFSTATSTNLAQLHMPDWKNPGQNRSTKVGSVVPEIVSWTLRLSVGMPDTSKRIHDADFCYHGTERPESGVWLDERPSRNTRVPEIKAMGSKYVFWGTVCSQDGCSELTWAPRHQPVCRVASQSHSGVQKASGE